MRIRQHFVAVFCLFLLIPGIRSFAATGTVTALTVTSGGSAVTTVAAGSMIALTATVTSGGTALTTGQVNFCDASATYCTDVHLLGTAQLTNAGTAVLRLIPGIGSHSYKAVFAGTNAYSTSSSAPSTLAVTFTGAFATATTITSSGSAGSYTLNASVVGSPRNATAAPTGLISFLNTTSNNQVVTTAPLVANAQPLSYSTPDPGVSVTGSTMVTGDFNEDGKPDLLLSDGPSPSPLITPDFTTALGHGDGTFTSMGSQSINGEYRMVAVGDFNGDGHLDAVALGSLGLTILLGNGDGTFNQITASASIQYGGPLVAGDFNGDGILDLAYTTQTAVMVSLGNGDGTFAAAVTGATAPADGDLVAGDFNGDGKLDVALSSPANSTVTLLLGQGDGTFVAATPAALAAVDHLVTGDFNGDGNLDLVGLSAANNIATVLLGSGNGTLTPLPTTIPSASPDAIAVGDFNGDGKADLVIGNDVPGPYTVQYALGSATVLLGNGDGTFSVGAPPVTIPFVDFLTIADFNEDGLSDFAVLNYFGGDFAGPDVFLGQLFPATATVSNVALAGSTGIQQIAASYPGDSNHGASVSTSIELTGTPTATITFSVPNHTYGDAPFSVAATSVSTGAFTYSVVSGPAIISGSTVTLTGLGVAVLQASQAAAEGYATGTQTASMSVGPASLTVTANSLARVFGAPNPTFTGSVIGAVNGDTFIETFSTPATIASIVGSYPVLPSVIGANLGNYTVNSTGGTLTVSQAGTATTFALSNNNTTLTASVASLTSGTPTGTVAFYEGQTQVGSGTVANGTASYTAAAFTSGDVVVSAQYSGDANFTQSAAPPILVLSVVPANTSVTVATTGSVVDQVNLAPAPGFTGTVQLSCSGLPQNASCSFQPASVAFTGSNRSSSASLTIQTGVASQTALLHPHPGGREGPAGTLAAVFLAPGLFLATIARRRRKMGIRGDRFSRWLSCFAGWAGP